MYRWLDGGVVVVVFVVIISFKEKDGWHLKVQNYRQIFKKLVVMVFFIEF